MRSTRGMRGSSPCIRNSMFLSAAKTIKSFIAINLKFRWHRGLLDWFPPSNLSKQGALTP